MLLQPQKHLFDLPDAVTYLNGAYMAPQLNSVEAIGISNLKRKAHPFLIKEADFFSEKEILRERFAKLIDTNDAQRIAIIPSVSFGVASAVSNIPFEKGDEILVLKEQFPSNYYSWKQLESEKGVQIKTIEDPAIAEGRGAAWNQSILEAISNKTKCVALPLVHWADGTKFDLIEIRKRTREVGAYLIIDGTQSVGAMLFSVNEIQPDALICGGYKWLLGPYGMGLAYFSERFDYGIPLDNNWMNHEGAENFSNLVNYNLAFKPKAVRYDIGGSSNFILTPMLSEAIRQLNIWGPKSIQEYCASLTDDAIEELQGLGYFIEDIAYRGSHLFGIYIPEHRNLETIKNRLIEEQVFVSYRGNAIRISPNVYNTKKDLKKLVACFV